MDFFFQIHTFQIASKSNSFSQDGKLYYHRQAKPFAFNSTKHLKHWIGHKLMHSKDLITYSDQQVLWLQPGWIKQIWLINAANPDCLFNMDFTPSVWRFSNSTSAYRGWCLHPKSGITEHVEVLYRFVFDLFEKSNEMFT